MAATFAIGYPVAFDASADERETRGFISITRNSPVSRLRANWMFEPPVSTPTARTTLIAASRSSWNASSLSVICGATVTESPVCTPIGSRFSIEQTITTLSARSRTTSSSNSSQPRTDSSTSTCEIGDSASPRSDLAMQLLGRVGEAAAVTAEREGRANDGRQRDAVEVVARRDDARRRHLQAASLDRLLEELAILGALDRLDAGADQLDPELAQDPVRSRARVRG